MIKKIEFLESPSGYTNDPEFVAQIYTTTSKHELFQELQNKLYIPEYFGFNWHALDECFRDSHWIDKFGIVLAHDVLANWT